MRESNPQGPGPLPLLLFGTAVACILLVALNAALDLQGHLSTSEDPIVAQWEQDGRFFVQGDDGALVTHHPNMPPAAFPPVKTPGEFRVVVLGGSQAMGDPYVHGRRELAGLDLAELNIRNSGVWLPGSSPT